MEKRFSEKLKLVSEIMEPGEWLTLQEIGTRANMPNWGSVASRIRDLKSYHGWDYEKRATGQTGVYEYRAWKTETGQLELLRVA